MFYSHGCKNPFAKPPCKAYLCVLTIRSFREKYSLQLRDSELLGQGEPLALCHLISLPL